MGVVYAARHVKLNRQVALKLMLSGGHAGKDDIARFRRETEAAACSRHPNIVEIFDAGEFDGKPFCSMEFVGGGNLASSLKNNPLEPLAAAELLEHL